MTYYTLPDNIEKIGCYKWCIQGGGPTRRRRTSAPREDRGEGVVKEETVEKLLKTAFEAKYGASVRALGEVHGVSTLQLRGCWSRLGPHQACALQTHDKRYCIQRGLKPSGPGGPTRAAQGVIIPRHIYKPSAAPMHARMHACTAGSAGQHMPGAHTHRPMSSTFTTSPTARP